MRRRRPPRLRPPPASAATAAVTGGHALCPVISASSFSSSSSSSLAKQHCCDSRADLTAPSRPWRFLWLAAAVMVALGPGATHGRHYIAPGPCTWTHVGDGASDSRHSPEPDVWLRCSVPAFSPHTLNLSTVDGEHTARLTIQCYEPGQPSTLQNSPFEHLGSRLQALHVQYCRLDRIPAGAFRGLAALRNLTVSQAGPVQVEPLSFRPLEPSLEHLDLSHNQMESLPADLFCPFLTLHSLNLSHNRLAELGSFGLIDPATGRLCLQELSHLDLSGNRLEFVPETSGVAALRNLVHLNLSGNHIGEMTELAISALRRLHVLDLSRNRLRTLPGRLFRDSDELRELHLARNGLIELPAGLFQGLSKLLALDISGNRITSDSLHPETFADLIRVQHLDLSGNALRRLGAKIFQNQYSLQVLSLESNQLETIDEGAFATLYNLHTLRLARNRFRHLPPAVLSGLFVLSELSLAHNLLEHVHEDALRNCTNLQALDLSANRFTAVPMAVNALAKPLDRLDLSGNKFTTLTDAGPLAGSGIRSLDLSDNYLVNVTRAALRPLATTLHHLRLDGNRLRALDKDTFTDLRQSLRTLRLDRNEFTEMTGALANLKPMERLEMLNLSRNALARFDYALIPDRLRSLDLSANRLEALGNYYEREAQLALEELDASGNRLKEITAASIPNAIRILNLQRNQIEKIDQFAFVAKHNVTYVDLRNNSLRRIDNNAFRLGVQRPTTGYFLPSAPGATAEMSARDYLAMATGGAKTLPPPLFLISGNPYYCDCTMEWLQRVNQLVGGVTGSGAISTYPRIGDLELVTCELPFSRQSAAGKEPPAQVIGLLQANSSNFLCRYRSHCFALCHCCEFDACDCEMMCPENCTCYYDQTWNTNIVDCSGGGYRQVPGRIPMDVTALYLDGNQLTSLNPHTFIGRKNLRILHLNHSLVESIVNRSFNGLVYLEELYLHHNQLSSLYGYEFESLNYLTILHLHHNRLLFINEKTFQPLRSLQVLRLDHNHLDTMGPWFGPMPEQPPAWSGGLRQQTKITISLGHNPWTCQCSAIGTMYEMLWQWRDRLTVEDIGQVRCANGTGLLASAALVDQCNLTGQYYGLFERHGPAAGIQVAPPTPEPRPPPPPEQDPPSYNLPPLMPVEADESEPEPEPDDPENDPDLTYQPIDMLAGFRPKLLPPPGLAPASTNQTQQHATYHGGLAPWPRPEPPSDPYPSISSSASGSDQRIGSSLLWLVFALPAVILVVVGGAVATVRHKQDIQLWFYGRYGIRLFESGGSGLCGLCFGRGRRGSANCDGSLGHRRRHAGGFNDGYVRDSEKLFDAFVIYARPDESFVAQQLAAELECGYPPYRLCLRYRDLPAPSPTLSNLVDPHGGPAPLTAKDHGYAFDAVTQAIECSRRTLVVITEQFLHSEWCKFELKAAHQETLSSCKTHRLIVVVVPGPSSANAPVPPAKQAEALLQRLDGDLKTCIRGVTILTWQERRFWEKLRFAMPASSTGGGGSVPGSGSGVIGFNHTTGTAGRRPPNQPVVVDSKGRTSTTVVVTNMGPTAARGYPGAAAAVAVPPSLSSSSSLARSSVLYDSAASQPIYYGGGGQHHYHYAQLPSAHQSTMSLHKMSGGGSSATLRSTPMRQVGGKPLPPPPNQPLPPVPQAPAYVEYTNQMAAGNPIEFVSSPEHRQQHSFMQRQRPAL